MSKTTFFKRVAMTAIAALGFGMITITPSQAAVASHTLTIDAATDAIDVGDTATAVLTHTFVNLGSAQDSVTLRAIVTSANASDAGTLTMSVTDSYTSAGNTAVGNVSPTYSYGGLTNASGAGGTNLGALLFADTNFQRSTRDSMTISHATADRSIGSVIRLSLIAPAAAGTYTVSVYTQVSDGGAALATATPAVTWTVTVTAPSVLANGATTSTLRPGEFATGVAVPWTGTAEGTDSSVVAAATSDATDTAAEATILVWQKNGAATNTAQESMTVTVSGPAYVSATATARPTAGTAITVAVPTADTSTPIYVWSNGTAGTATITVLGVSSGVTFGTETVKFSGDQTTIAIDGTYKKVLRAGGFANSSAFDVKVTDANGTLVTGKTVSWVSSNTGVVLDGTCSEYSTIGYPGSFGYYLCSPSTAVGSTSGQSATLTVRVVNPAITTSTSYLTTTYPVTLGGSISTLELTADKATYSPGEAMILTLTAKDASGNPTYDGQAGNTSLVATKALGGTALGSVMNTYYDGKSTSQSRSGLDPRVFRNDNTLFAPAASGAFTVRGNYGTDSTKSVSLTLTVGDDGATAAANAASDAAAEAIDAANAATDAANLAAEAADAATVAAEEARDAADAATAAVEALATEVATLMAALKAQITTLANTVAKIAKKVKA